MEPNISSKTHKPSKPALSTHYVYRRAPSGGTFITNLSRLKNISTLFLYATSIHTRQIEEDHGCMTNTINLIMVSAGFMFTFFAELEKK